MKITKKLTTAGGNKAIILNKMLLELLELEETVIITITVTEDKKMIIEKGE